MNAEQQYTRFVDAMLELLRQPERRIKNANVCRAFTAIGTRAEREGAFGTSLRCGRLALVWAEAAFFHPVTRC